MRPEVEAIFERDLQRKRATWKKLAEGLTVVKVLKESDFSEAPSAVTNGRWYLLCPGCYLACKKRLPSESERVWLLGAIHCFSDQVHEFDGNVHEPTLSPSLLCQHTVLDENGQETPHVCHSFVINGVMQYLNDCTHPMKGCNVELMDTQLYLDAR